MHTIAIFRIPGGWIQWISRQDQLAPIGAFRPLFTSHTRDVYSNPRPQRPIAGRSPAAFRARSALDAVD